MESFEGYREKAYKQLQLHRMIRSYKNNATIAQQSIFYVFKNVQGKMV